MSDYLSYTFKQCIFEKITPYCFQIKIHTFWTVHLLPKYDSISANRFEEI